MYYFSIEFIFEIINILDLFMLTILSLCYYIVKGFNNEVGVYALIKTILVLIYSKKK